MFSGSIRIKTSPERYTPYHISHSTKVKGLFENTGGDVRFYNNMFLSYNFSDKETPGLAVYDEYPVYSDNMFTSIDKTYQYVGVKFPIWTYGNLYFKDGKPFNKEKNYVVSNWAGKYELKETDKGWYFTFNCPDETKRMNTFSINTSSLGQTFISESVFDNPDGTSFVLEKDFYGKMRGSKPSCGPFESFDDGIIWKSK